MTAGVMEFIDLDSVIVADSGNPIADLASLGHGLMNAALAATAALMGAAAGSGLLESVPFVGKGLDMFESVWQVADGFVSTVLGLLLIAGAVLAYLLPALPFIRFLFAILGWIVTVAVAVLAVTVFAACPCDARRRQPAGDTGHTPGLAVPSRADPAPAADAVRAYRGLFRVPGRDRACSTRSGFRRCATRGPPADSDPIGFLAMLTLYVMVAYGLMNASFKLIDLLPSAVLDWIGGRGGTGDEGGERVGGAGRRRRRRRRRQARPHEARRTHPRRRAAMNRTMETRRT